MPEEVNRVVTDRVSDYLFAPSADAVDNLRAEGYRDDQIHLVGNVMVDTLLANLDRARGLATSLARLGLEPGGYGLVTLHRPANVDDPGGARPRCCRRSARSPRSCRCVLPGPPAGGRPAAPSTGPAGRCGSSRPPATSTSSPCRRRPAWC